MATHSAGVTFSWSGSLGTIFKISRKGLKWTECDATVLTSVNVFKEFIPGFGDGGSLTFSMRWNKTNFNTLYTAAAARTIATGTMTFPDGSTFACSCFCSMLDDEIPEDNTIDTEVNFKFTGKPVFTPAA